MARDNAAIVQELYNRWDSMSPEEKAQTQQWAKQMLGQAPSPVNQADPKAVQGWLQKRYGNILSQPSSDVDVAKEVLKGAGKFAVNPLGVGQPTFNVPEDPKKDATLRMGEQSGLLIPRGEAQEAGALLASSPSVVKGAAEAGEALATKARDVVPPGVANVAKGTIKAVASKFSPVGRGTLRYSGLSDIQEGISEMLGRGPKGVSTPTTVEVSPGSTTASMNMPVPPPSKVTVPQGPTQAPAGTNPPNPTGMPIPRPAPGLPVPLNTQNVRVPPGVTPPPMGRNPVNPTGMPMPASPQLTPPTAPQATTPPVVSTSPAPDVVAARDRLNVALGGKPGEPLVLGDKGAAEASADAGQLEHMVNRARKNGLTPEAVSKMSPEEKVQARRYINDSKLQSPEVKSQFIQRLGLGEEEPFKFAKGGVVVPKHTVLNTVGANKKGTQKETKDLKPLVVTTGLKKSAEVPAEMARSGEDIVRGSLDVPLAPQGEEQAKELSRRLKARGGLDTLESSDLHRARQTAKYISEALGVPISVSKSWRPWMLGELEGQPTKKVLDKIHTYITKKPNVKVPGMGEKSTAPGESFVKFKNRVIGQYKEKLKELKRNPYKKIGVVTHYRDLRLAQAWASRGFPQSAEVDTKLMTEKGDDPPISVHRMYWKGSTPKLDKVDMGSREKLPGGIYLVRHGATALNGRDLKGNPI